MPKGVYLRTEQHRKNISVALKKAGIVPPSQKGRGGPLHWNWQGGKTSQNILFRQSLEYKEWRKSVMIRDDFTCQLCGQRGGKLHADHIKPFALYPKLRLVLENGRTLCVSCHYIHGANWGKKVPTWALRKAGKKGGLVTKKRGREYYSRIARIRWDKKRGPTVHIPILV
jgi:5-methylcytosine-specific restriction endonuclease McrA